MGSIKVKGSCSVEEYLRAGLIGQQDAVKTVSCALRRKSTGWMRVKRPLVFLFVGTSGVGKTEMAKRIAMYIHGEPTCGLKQKGFVTIDMSNCAESHSITKLIGSSPGYVGYDKGGILTNALRDYPRAVVLLDEVEKAHVNVLNVLLSLFDEGRIADSRGFVVDCPDAIFVLTSNLGSDLILKHYQERKNVDGVSDYSIDKQFCEKELYPVLKEFFQRDEFIGRLDEIVYFTPLSSEQVDSIINLELNFWKTFAKKKHNGLEFEWRPEAVQHLKRNYYNFRHGVRSVRHGIERSVISKVAKMDESGQIAVGKNYKLIVATETKMDESEEVSIIIEELPSTVCEEKQCTDSATVANTDVSEATTVPVPDEDEDDEDCDYGVLNKLFSTP